jgi:hypothetical protein
MNETAGELGKVIKIDEAASRTTWVGSCEARSKKC